MLPEFGRLRRVLAVGIGSALLLAVPSTAHATTDSDRLERLAHKVVEAGAPGSIVSQRVGQHTAAGASGVADVRTGRTANVDDRYRIGSNTKTMVAVVVLQLVEEGELGLDDSVAALLPDLGLDERITVRHLLQHTSGFHTDTMLGKGEYSYDAMRFRYFAPEELVEIALTNPAPRPEPGTHHEYSNTNYVLAGMLIEEITGNPVEYELQHRILTPLRLDDTSFERVSPFILGSHLRGYLPQGQGKPPYDTTTYSFSWVWTAGAVVSTADDQTRFLQGLFDGDLLSPGMLDAMTDVNADGYGLGVFRVPVPCVPGGYAYGHNGIVFGYTSWVLSTPDGERQASAVGNLMAGDSSMNSTVSQAAAGALCD